MKYKSFVFSYVSLDAKHDGRKFDRNSSTHHSAGNNIFLSYVYIARDMGIAGNQALDSLLSYQLTKREAEVAELLLSGMDNKGISDTLCISINTVRQHIQRIYKKTGVVSRSQLILLLNKHSNEPIP